VRSASFDLDDALRHNVDIRNSGGAGWGGRLLISAYITAMNGFNSRSSSDASFVASERARARSSYRPTRTKYQSWRAESLRSTTFTSG